MKVGGERMNVFTPFYFLSPPGDQLANYHTSIMKLGKNNSSWGQTGDLRGQSYGNNKYLNLLPNAALHICTCYGLWCLSPYHRDFLCETGKRSDRNIIIGTTSLNSHSKKPSRQNVK